MATAVGLGSCAVGAFHDHDVNRMLERDGREEGALHMIAAGRI